MLASYGVTIDLGTLVDWVIRAAWWPEPLYDKRLAFIRSQPKVFCDETPLPQLDPGRSRTKTCQLWAHAIDDRPWNGLSLQVVHDRYCFLSPNHQPGFGPT